MRKEVLEKYGKQCMDPSCKSKQNIEVDHIKPRATHPHLELEFDNLQVLCRDCNRKKGAFHSKDFRENFKKNS